MHLHDRAGTLASEFIKLPLITSETHTEWKILQHYFSKEQEGDTKTQLKELTIVINF